MDDIPFRGSDAIRSGALTRNDLRRRYRAVYRDVYIGKDGRLTARTRAGAAWLATGSPLAGVSAAAVFGTRWLSAEDPAEIVRRDRHAPAGIVAHSWSLQPDDVCMAGRMSVTTPARTAFDIGRTRTRWVAVPILDALMNATRLQPEEVFALAGARPGVRGVNLLRKALEMADGGAESPQETRLRMVLVDAGLPKPRTQIEFRNLRIRVDMGWRRWKVAVEYDGIQHWNDPAQRSWDIERLARLEAAGWAVVRVSAQMLARHTQLVIERVREKLRAAGCPV